MYRVYYAIKLVEPAFPRNTDRHMQHSSHSLYGDRGAGCLDRTMTSFLANMFPGNCRIGLHKDP